MRMRNELYGLLGNDYDYQPNLPPIHSLVDMPNRRYKDRERSDSIEIHHYITETMQG